MHSLTGPATHTHTHTHTTLYTQPCMDFEDKGFCLAGDECPYSHGDEVFVVDETAISPYSVCVCARACVCVRVLPLLSSA